MANRQDIPIDQGTTFSMYVQLNSPAGNPVDLTTYTIESQIKKDYSSCTYVSFDTSGSNTGTITVGLDANTSLSMDPGRYVYDIILTGTDGTISRILQGQVTLNPCVSRSLNINV